MAYKYEWQKYYYHQSFYILRYNFKSRYGIFLCHKFYSFTCLNNKHISNWLLFLAKLLFILACLLFLLLVGLLLNLYYFLICQYDILSTLKLKSAKILINSFPVWSYTFRKTFLAFYNFPLLQVLPKVYVKRRGHSSWSGKSSRSKVISNDDI